MVGMKVHYNEETNRYRFHLFDRQIEDFGNGIEWKTFIGDEKTGERLEKFAGIRFLETQYSEMEVEHSEEKGNGIGTFPKIRLNIRKDLLNRLKKEGYMRKKIGNEEFIIQYIRRFSE